MTERVSAELELLRRVEPDLDFLENENWVRLPRYDVPDGWTAPVVELAFRIPDTEAQPPYAFWVRPELLLAGGAPGSNYTAGATTGFGGMWGQFSWSPITWRPQADIEKGDNMTHFLRSVRDRLKERS
jgi:hypothetical protein